MPPLTVAGAEVLRPPRVISSAPREAGRVEQRFWGHVHARRVGYEAVGVGEGELHRLDLQDAATPRHRPAAPRS